MPKQRLVETATQRRCLMLCVPGDLSIPSLDTFIRNAAIDFSKKARAVIMRQSRLAEATLSISGHAG